MNAAPTAAAPDRRSLNLWYDGGCPICTAEIGLMRRLDSVAAIKFVDLSLRCSRPTDSAVRLAWQHAQPRDGLMASGAAAFVAMCHVISCLRPLPALASPPPVQWLSERVYLFILRLRPVLQAWARWAMWRQRAVYR